MLTNLHLAPCRFIITLPSGVQCCKCLALLSSASRIFLLSCGWCQTPILCGSLEMLINVSQGTAFRHTLELMSPMADGFLGEPLAQDSLPAWLTLVAEQLSAVMVCNSKWQPLQLRAQRYASSPGGQIVANLFLPSPCIAP